MANIVKWWRRQFKQYKQFSVLQECTTDSEELIYKAQVPLNSPPDVVLTSHRKNLSIPQATTTTTPPANSKIANQEILTPSKSCKKTKESRVTQSKHLERERLQKRHSIATTRNLEALEAGHVNLNELSCDVSFNESPKSPQPVQFSFTLYDLDGYDRKLTKDDIAGIVSTIYESIGNTVVVPHGKKTINVKLTVSPEAKSNTFLNTTNRFNKNQASISGDSEGHEARFKMKNSARNSGEYQQSKMNVYESINNIKSTNIELEDNAEAIYVENIKKEVLKHFSEKRLYIEEEEEENDFNATKTQPKQFVAPSKKKILRRQRRKQRSINESSIRGRSLSVGNDFKWRKNKNAEEELECSENLLRKHELIEIIRESMEKNRLCFQQNKGKSNIIEKEKSSRPRPRSNTMQNTVTCTKEARNRENCTDHHLCGFDSFLHSTRCTNLDSKFESLKKGSSSQTNCRNRSSLDSPVLSQLKTSVLNQLDQNLTAEQKLTMKFNNVEKWLHEREVSQECTQKNTKCFASEISHENNQSRLHSTPKSSTNEKLVSKKNILHTPHHLKQRKEAINNSRNNKMFLENLRIASDCENLIGTEEEENFNESETTVSKSSSLRFVHIHHHFYHFDDEGKFK